MKNRFLNLSVSLLFLCAININAQVSFVENMSTSFTGAQKSSIAYADIDGDNDQDVLITGRIGFQMRTSELYRNDGAGNFTLISGTPFPAVEFGSVAFADIDGDNDQDVLISGLISNSPTIMGSAKLYRNDGTGNFTEIIGTPFDDLWQSSINFSDIDGDNDQDVLISGLISNTAYIAKLYKNDGFGVFTLVPGSPFIGVGNKGATVFADVDGDNDQDVLISGVRTGGAITRLYTNDGFGTFTMVSGTPFPDVYTGDIAFADIDNDNDQDVLITGAFSEAPGGAITKLYTNDGSGNFTLVSGTPFQAVYFSSVAFADVDNDNDQDVLICGNTDGGSNISELFINDGSGNYALETGLPLEGMWNGSIAFFDADNDNDQDLLLVGSGSVSTYMANLYLNETMLTYTYNNGWSPSDPSGVATSADNIMIASGDAVINTNTTCNLVTINPGAGLTVDTGITLTPTGGLVLESSATSYSSLILDGTVSGTMTYERHVNINGSGTTGSNDLISAPLTGQDFASFAAANPNILNNGSVYLFGPLEKVTGQYVNWAATETTTLEEGVGYRTGTTDNGTVTFTGTAENGTITNNIQNTGSNNAEWNLVGNPYPSYLKVEDFLTYDADGLTNIQLFDAATAAIYGYDGSALNGWTIYNTANTTASTLIAPGQGFFVSADATNVIDYDLEFTPAMRSTGSGDDFISGRNAELIYLNLGLSSDAKSYKTEFYFNNNASEGLDKGYDAALFENDPNFAMYSHLLQDNVGKPIALQTLNPTSLADVSIPLGVNANQGEQITFSIIESTLPASVNVYLEDTVANTSTLLNTSDYIITPATNLSGTGRFFLRTTEGALSTIENDLDNLNIFALNNTKELVVSGRLQEPTTLNLYDMQGRKVMSVELDSSVIENRIGTASLSTGVYVTKVFNNDQVKTNKVIIK